MPGRDYALTVPQIKTAAVLYQHAGMSRREVAAHFGVSDMAVRNALKLAGVRMRSRKEAKVLRPGGRRAEQAAEGDA